GRVFLVHVDSGRSAAMARTIIRRPSNHPPPVTRATRSTAHQAVLLDRFDGLGDAQGQFAEPAPQGFAGDPEPAGGLVLTPAGVLENTGQEESIDVPVNLGVQIAGVRPQSFPD